MDRNNNTKQTLLMAQSPGQEILRNRQKSPPVSDCGRVIGYKMKAKKSAASLYTRNEQVETNTKSGALASPSMKHFNINLTKCVKHLNERDSKNERNQRTK